MTLDQKKCRFCAELIQRDAKVCRYCGRDVTSSGVMAGAKFGCGVLLVLPILLAVGLVVLFLAIGVRVDNIREHDEKTGRQDTAPTATQVSPSEFELVSHRGEWENDRLRVIGEILNKGAVAAGVEIEVIARDDAGNIVASERFWPNSIGNIAPGKTCAIGYTITRDRRAKTIDVNVVDVRVWRRAN